MGAFDRRVLAGSELAGDKVTTGMSTETKHIYKYTWHARTHDGACRRRNRTGGSGFSGGYAGGVGRESERTGITARLWGAYLVVCFWRRMAGGAPPTVG